jgi:hypothetical protein
MADRANARANGAAASEASRVGATWQPRVDVIVLEGDGGGGGDGCSDGGDGDDWEEESDEDDDARPLRFRIAPSLIPQAGDGLFFASALAAADRRLLVEEAPVIKRADAKKILADPVWALANPVIQINGDRFLDLRRLLLYKSNHAFSSEPRCNVRVEQVGEGLLALVATRQVRRGEELLWEYSPTWYPPGS